MEKIPTNQAKAGMKLAREVMDDMGRTVLANGTVLTASHCRMLSKREIEAIQIHDSEAEAIRQTAENMSEDAKAEAEDDATVRRIARIQHLFTDVMDSESMQKLFKIALDHAKKGSISG